MCTVSFLPIKDEAASFIFTSNRDEAAGRIALQPALHTVNGQTWFGPRDEKGGGTWFGVHDRNYAFCILNGAFEKHQHQPPYKRSRGLLIPDFLGYGDPVLFQEQYDFEGMEPFTLLIVDFGGESVLLQELRWDERNPTLTRLDAQKPHIWSSATLYTTAQAEVKQAWFNAWLAQQPTYSQEAIFTFHKTAGIGDPTIDLMMNRGAVRTTSISSLLHTGKRLHFQYFDTLNDTFFEQPIF